jgi:hypothetical protein
MKGFPMNADLLHGPAACVQSRTNGAASSRFLVPFRRLGISASGVRFKNAWGFPVCSPSRAAMYTGRYPLRGLFRILSAHRRADEADGVRAARGKSGGIDNAVLSAIECYL